MTTLVPESPVSSKAIPAPAPVGASKVEDEDLVRLAKAVEVFRKRNAAPPDYAEVQRDPEFWADMLGFWR